MRETKTKKKPEIDVRFNIKCTEKEANKLKKIIKKSGLKQTPFFRKWIQEL